MPKVVENKLVFKSEDRISPDLKAITNQLVKFAEASALVSKRLKEVEQISLKPSPERRPLPPTYKPKDSMWAGIARGPQRMAVGGIAGVGGFTQAALGEHGAAGVSGLAQRIGAGIPYLGIPLLAFGAALGAVNLAAGPAREWNLGTAHLQAVLGEDYMNVSRKLGTQGGYTAEHTAQFMNRLYRSGAQEAWGPMAAMGYGKVRPEQMVDYVENLSKGMLTGARTKESYKVIAKEIAAQIERAGKTTSVVEYMDLLTNLTQQQIAVLGDIDDNQRRDTQVMALWMNQTQSGMMRGQMGAGTMGKWTSWVRNPQGPGATMLLYSTLANNPEFRKYLEERGIAGRGERLGMHKFLMAMETPLAGLYAGKGMANRLTQERFAMMFGPKGEKIWSETQANKVWQLFKEGKSPEEVQKELAKETEEQRKKGEVTGAPTTTADRGRAEIAKRSEDLVNTGNKIWLNVEKLNTNVLATITGLAESTGALKALNDSMTVLNSLFGEIKGTGKGGAQTTGPVIAEGGLGKLSWSSPTAKLVWDLIFGGGEVKPK